jgi:hypothetical protein
MFGVYSRTPYPGEFPSASESMAVSDAPAWVIIVSTCLFVASYAPTWGPVSWAYPPELFPLRLRGKAVALATAANWTFNFALAYFVPPAFENITWKTYVIFAVFCAAMNLHVFFLFPETANKSLEEVAQMFDDKQPGGEFVSTYPLPRFCSKEFLTNLHLQRSNTSAHRHGRPGTPWRPSCSRRTKLPPRKIRS